MNLTVEELTHAIRSATDLKALKAELCDALEARQVEERNALIAQIIGQSPSQVPANTTTGATNTSQ